jgi:hypothetical protein
VKRRNIIATGLVLAAVTILTAQIIKGSRARPVSPPTGTTLSPPPPASVSMPHKVVAYYFHRTVRCDTCRAIEAQAHAVVEAGFADFLQAGLLEWHAINIEETGNGHFATDYDLTTPALVLVEMVNGRPARWTKLDHVWELVHIPPAFTHYVQDELHGYLGVL